MIMRRKQEAIVSCQRVSPEITAAKNEIVTVEDSLGPLGGTHKLKPYGLIFTQWIVGRFLEVNR